MSRSRTDGMATTASRSSRGASSHQITIGSVSCVPDVATETAGILDRIPERLPFDLPLALPPKHLVAGHRQPRQRRAHEFGDDAEIFGDDLRPRLAEHAQHALAKRQLRFLHPAA